MLYVISLWKERSVLAPRAVYAVLGLHRGA